MDPLGNLRSLVKDACDPSSGRRVEAERCLLDIQNDKTSWSTFLDLLMSAEDNLLFFIGQGLLKSTWRQWFTLSESEQALFTSKVLQVLVRRHDLSPFVRSKIEQVLGSICINSQSLHHVLQIVGDINNPTLEIGLSALVTVLETILMDDPRILPKQKTNMLTNINEYVTPITELAVQICNHQANIAENRILIISLKLLNIIISKLSVGGHLTLDTFFILFKITENGFTNPQWKSPQLAVETLTDLMNKRYMPRGGGASGGNNNNSSATATSMGGDAGGEVLVQILSRAVGLVNNYRNTVGVISEDCPIITQLLSLYKAFLENHLDRCLPSSSSANMTSASPSAGSLAVGFQSFISELVAVTRACVGVTLQLRCVQVWTVLLQAKDGEVVDVLITNTDIGGGVGVGGGVNGGGGSPLLECLLTNSLLLRNEKLREDIEDMEEEVQCDCLLDKEQLNNKYNKTSRNEDMDDDSSGAASSLLKLSEFILLTFGVSSSGCNNTLLSLVPSMLEQSLQLLFTNDMSGTGNGSGNTLLSRQCAAFDVMFLLRLMPICVSAEKVITQISSLISQLVQGRFFTRGLSHIALLDGAVK
eukprot:gene11700-24509_t